MEELSGALLSSSTMMPSTSSSRGDDISGSAVFLDEELERGGVVGLDVVGDSVGLEDGGGANVGGLLLGSLDNEGVEVGCSLSDAVGKYVGS